MKSKRRYGILTVNTDVDVEIGISEIIEFITDYAEDFDIREIKEALGYATRHSDIEFTSLDGGLVKQQKLELLSKAFAKFSLAQLQEKLDPTNSLI